MRRLLLALSLCAVALYACVLPLWEGWDEPFHYGRLQTLAARHELGVLGRTTLSQEIGESLGTVPLSHFLASTIPGAISFERWQQLSQTKKKQLRQALLAISPDRRELSSSVLNYEAQQTPLVYILAAPLDMMLRRVGLLWRVLILRWIFALAAMLLIFQGLERLTKALALQPSFEAAALFCATSVQMLWASVAHIGNDGFAIAAAIWFVALLTNGSPPLLVGCVLGIGLLTKAYLLALVPVFLLWLGYLATRKKLHWSQALSALVAPPVIAGGWYVRNLLLYHSFSGTQESVAGITAAKAMRAIPNIHWGVSFLTAIRDSLWTGNWSFTAFSRSTLTIEELLMACGLMLVALNARRMTQPEKWLWLAALFFVAALVYQTCVTWAATGGVAVVPEPWYAQWLLLLVWVLLFRGGCMRAPRVGRWLSLLLCGISAWIAFATFFVKLTPGYAGGLNRGAIKLVRAWWGNHPSEDMAMILPAPPELIFTLLCLYLLLLLASSVFVWRGLMAADVEGTIPH